MAGNSIVQVNVSQQVAPAPATLQQTGAFISQGGTNASPWTASLLTQLSDLTPLLNGALAISTMVLSSGSVTVTATNPHGFTINDTIELTISGVTPTAYNGIYLCTVTGTTTFTYPLGGSPGAVSIQGMFTEEDVAELLSMATTFYAQGNSQSVYVLELGPGNVSDGVSSLNAYITANPNSNYTPGAVGYFYSYLVPREWDAVPQFLAMLASYENTTARTYFFVTTTLQNYHFYTNLMKCVIALIESPAQNAYPANALSALSYSGAYGANALVGLTWASTNGGTVTASTTSAHTVPPGALFSISGCAPGGYNGTFTALPGTTASTLVYALATNPGTETTLGTLVAATQGTCTGTTLTNHGVTPGTYFTIVGTTPAGYSGTFLALPGTSASTLIYASPVALAASTVYGTLQASYFANAGIPSTEFSHASDFWVALHYNPSTTNRVTPFAFSFVYGVTPFPYRGNSALRLALKTANINIIGTGAEGGISNTILLWGTTMDGNQFNYWYSVDWVQINLDLDTANAVINGSNNPINPLYYNQPGIDRLQAVAAATMTRGIIYGLVLGTVTQTALDGPVLDANLDAGLYADQTVVNAVPFVTYSIENPSDYALGKYAGFAVVYMPQQGFTNIIYNVVVTEIVAM